MLYDVKCKGKFIDYGGISYRLVANYYCLRLSAVQSVDMPEMHRHGTLLLGAVRAERAAELRLLAALKRDMSHEMTLALVRLAARGARVADVQLRFVQLRLLRHVVDRRTEHGRVGQQRPTPWKRQQALTSNGKRTKGQFEGMIIWTIFSYVISG